ncbi:MAG: hypothetical protein K0R75_185 [Paenibacillaceae bacterium]|nr:hypothetical protein [Paenibacillaceae bacterium]
MNVRVILGSVLLLFGVFLFLNKGAVINPGTIFAYFWPSLFVIPLGLFFHWLYFSVTKRRGVGLLVPGGILFTAGLVCQLAMLLDGWSYMWPGFILAVAVGLFELYFFGSRHRGLLIPIYILTVIGLLFSAVFSIGTFFSNLQFSQPFVAIALIVIGALMLFIRRKQV